MPQLDPTWFASQLFWLAITFLTLYVLLARVILPPIMNIMAQRKGTVESDLVAAQTFKSQAEEAKELYERTLAEARARSQQLLNDAIQEQKTRAEQAGKELDVQIASKLSDAESRIQAKKQELLTALDPAATELAQVIVAKLVQHAPENGGAQHVANSKTGR